jgi:hypothetical protein
VTLHSDEIKGGGSSRPLLPHHAEMLANSAINGTVARERGYFSVSQKKDLEALGFGRSQQVVPALVIPIHGVVAGEEPWFVHRPDNPRRREVVSDAMSGSMPQSWRRGVRPSSMDHGRGR